MMGPRIALSLAVALTATAWSGTAQATILTFDLSDSSLDTGVYPGGFPEGFGYATLGQPFSPLSGYGHNVTGATGANSNGTTSFSYGEAGEGYTPDLTANFGPHGILDGGPVLWREDFGDLTNVLYQGGPNPFLEIDILADATHDVLLYGFDIAGWQADYTVAAVTVFDGFPNALFTPTNQIFEAFGVAAPGPGGGATSFTFATPLQSNRIFIRIDTRGLAGEDQREVIGIDNIRFGQVDRLTPVPEPASLTLLTLGLGSLGLVRARRRRKLVDAAA